MNEISEKYLNKERSVTSKNKVSILCKVCGIEFFTFPCRKHQIKFCSKKCREQKIKINCNYCNINFFVGRNRKNTAKYCSIKCRQKSMARIMSGEYNPRWKGKDILIICKNCGNEFASMEFSNIERKKYCSRKCQINSLQLRK